MNLNNYETKEKNTEDKMSLSESILLSEFVEVTIMGSVIGTLVGVLILLILL